MKAKLWIVAAVICALAYIPAKYFHRAWSSTADSRKLIPFDAASWRASTLCRLAMTPDLIRRSETREFPQDKATIMTILGPARFREDWRCYYWVAGVTFADSLNRFDLPCTYLLAYFNTNDTLRKLELKSWPM